MSPEADPVPIPTDRPVWDRFFTVSGLVIVGSKEESGGHDLAPKHLAMPLGWDNYFCFVCTPRHRTYHNVRRHGAFTVSYPRPDGVLLASLAAAPRCDDRDKPSLSALPTFAAPTVDGVLVRGCYLYLECLLHSILDGFGDNSLLIGRVTGALASEDALRANDRDEADQIYRSPLLAYLSPGRYAEVRHSAAFPFHEGFSR
jgi:flavin reductase (DIM6/NTAB) family NADH-FMN oxidoreductase RutF